MQIFLHRCSKFCTAMTVPAMQNSNYIIKKAKLQIISDYLLKLILTFSLYKRRIVITNFTIVEEMNKMKQIAKISDAEYHVIKTLWEKSPLTSNEIIEMLKPVTGWSPTTIYTLITRLVNKKAIKFDDSSSPRMYYPIITQKNYRQKENELFIKKVYDGSLNLMIKNIVEEQNLSDEEIEDLKKILDNKKSKGR